MSRVTKNIFSMSKIHKTELYSDAQNQQMPDFSTLLSASTQVLSNAIGGAVPLGNIVTLQSAASLLPKLLQDFPINEILAWMPDILTRGPQAVFDFFKKLSQKPGETLSHPLVIWALKNSCFVFGAALQLRSLNPQYFDNEIRAILKNLMYGGPIEGPPPWESPHPGAPPTLPKPRNVIDYINVEELLKSGLSRCR